MPKLKIEKLGPLGDGIARLDNRTVFVPNALPGETVLADGEPPHLNNFEILESGETRQIPPCPHFGACGGCTFQHATPEFLLKWKQEQVELAFSKLGITVKVQETLSVPTASRRRISLTAQRFNEEVQLGFKATASDQLIDITTCSIVLPSIENEFENLRQVVKTLMRGNEEIRLSINACDNGIDLDIETDRDPSDEMTMAFVRSVAKRAYLRASINGEVVIEKSKPVVSFGGAEVAIPPGGFLQAVAEAESQMAELVCAHLNKCKRVVDLFCGSGTFTFPLAKKSRVDAVEVSEEALNALRSAKGKDGLKTVTPQQRDLFELPLTTTDLKPFDGVCLDPPRAGAKLQVEQIAKTNIKRIAYVSCSPVTLAEDSKLLLDAGYELKNLTPVDQFVYSPHVEVVALFIKANTKVKRSIFR